MIDLRRDIEYGDDWWLGYLEKNAKEGGGKLEDLK
jgi:hypothetical protein